MESRSLVPPAAPAAPPGMPHAFALPVAQMRSVFQSADVERRLARLPERDHDHLRSTHVRMLERGPERFQVKPAGIPDMAPLYEALPNFHEVLDDVRRHVALAQDSRDGLEVTPMLLLGPPGIGKTHFAKQLADLLGTGMDLVPMGSMTAGWLLSGSSSQWKGARPGKVFEALVEGRYANPVIVADEIAEVPIDASQVVWITTANDARGIPDPILNRMNVFEVPPPTPEQARRIALRLYQSIRAGHDWGTRFDEAPQEPLLDRLAGLAPRDMRRALMAAFGNARLDGRNTMRCEDLPRGTARSRIGFVQ